MAGLLGSDSDSDDDNSEDDAEDDTPEDVPEKRPSPVFFQHAIGGDVGFNVCSDLSFLLLSKVYSYPPYLSTSAPPNVSKHNQFTIQAWTRCRRQRPFSSLPPLTS